MEEEIKMDVTEHGGDAGKEGETSAEKSISSPIKRKGRSQGSKKLKVCVTDINLMRLVSGISNGGSMQPQRGRGRPKLVATKHTEEEVSENDHAHNTPRGKGRPKGSKKKKKKKKTSEGDNTPKKRGRPKKSLGNNIPATEQLPNGATAPPKLKRGRPKGSVKRVSEVSKEGEGRSVKRKRGRPRGSLNKKPRLQIEVSSEEEEDSDRSINAPTKRVQVQLRATQSNGIPDTPKRGRGRPRKNEVEDVSQLVKRGRGRPKGSLNRKRPASKVQSTMNRSPKALGRPRKQPSKRGRPRKNPVPTPVERNQPKVWKPLGRPRKYPRVDPPEGAPAAPRRSRGRPRKSESKKGAHLRKSLPAASSQSNPDWASQRKSVQAASAAKTEAVVLRKRGRPKGSGNKNKARVETELDRASPDGSKEKTDAPAVEEHEAGPVEEEEEEEEVGENDMQKMSTEPVGDAEETLIKQDDNFEVTDEA